MNGLDQAFFSACAQLPMVVAIVWVARYFLSKQEEKDAKLIKTFEEEVKACEGRYQMVFDELMKLKDLIK